MPVHTVLTTVDELPLTRAIVEHLIPLPDDVRGWIFVVCAGDQRKRVDAALAKIPSVAPYGEKTTAKADARTLNDVRAIAWSLTSILGAPAEGPFVTKDRAYLSVEAFALATTDRKLVRATLEKAGLTVADAASLVADRAPIEDEAAITTALAPFEEHFSPEVATAVRAYLEGPDGPIPEIILKAESNDYGSKRASFIYDALSGAVERWNPRTSGKILDLWLALRGPLETVIRLGRGEDDLPPELGFDRARMIAAALEARGLAPALAALAGASCDGASMSFLATTLLPHPEAFTAAVAVDRKVARALAGEVNFLALDLSPRFKDHVRAFLASHTQALGSDALLTLAKQGYAADIDDAHLVNAAMNGDLVEVCKLAAQLETAEPKHHAGMKRRANERWIAAAEPLFFATTLRAVLERADEGVDADVAWGRLIDLFDANPADPFGDGPKATVLYSDDYVIGPLPKPQGTTKARLVALCEKHGKALGARLKALEKKAGIKRKVPPSPYADSDLDGLPEAWAKAWKTARTKSWIAEIRLPASAGKKALADAEKTLGAKLPGDVRSFYELHDGAGRDECFRGCRLYGIEEAVEQRQRLLTIGGAPFDAAWLPLTDNGGGDHHCVTLTGPKAGSVVHFNHEVGAGRVLTKSFAAFVQSSSWE